MDSIEEGKGRTRCRGRPRISRHIDLGDLPRCYAPQCRISEGQEVLSLLPDEVEILRLVDLEGLEQEEAAAHLGISRKTAWRDLHAARRKVADALVHGKILEMTECLRRREGHCPRWNLAECPKHDGGPCPRGFSGEASPDGKTRRMPRDTDRDL
jgi:predicted DNA-binding protein (UPF0251 family)